MQQGLPQSKPPEPTPQTILAQNIQQRQNGNFLHLEKISAEIQFAKTLRLSLMRFYREMF